MHSPRAPRPRPLYADWPPLQRVWLLTHDGWDDETIALITGLHETTVRVLRRKAHMKGNT